MSEVKVIHTSDWHLGKRLYRKDREAEQKLFLDWLVQTLKEEKADVMVLAGDVFDSPTPPHSALKLYYDFLKQASDLGTNIVVISGNHDSQGLINAPKSVLEDKNIHLFSKLHTELERNICELNIGEEVLLIKCMPYFRNYELIKMAQSFGLFEEEKEREQVFQQTLKHFLDYWPPQKKEGKEHKLLLAHHVFGNYSAAGSEHFIGLSGIESISLDWLKNNCDYAALGHIHKYQSLSKEQLAFYTGSPVQMRFSENKKKYVQKIVFDPEAPVQVSKLPIPVFRELVAVKTDTNRLSEDLTKALKNQTGDLPPFVEVQVDMLESKTGLADFVKDLCEEQGAQLLSFLPRLRESETIEEESALSNDLNINELFKRFYAEKYPEQEKPPAHLERHFKELLEESFKEGL